jgi:excisionase family DNA binding protein
VTRSPLTTTRPPRSSQGGPARTPEIHDTEQDTPMAKIIIPENIVKLLTPMEVSGLFNVDPKTVTRWAKDGKLSSYRTPGGHRRYDSDEVYQLLNNSRS